MSGRRTLRLSVAVAATAAFALATAYALADTPITSSPTCCSYSSSSFTITGGQVAQFQNATTSGGGFYGGTSHSVVADQASGGKPLFISKIVPSGSTTAVNGTQYLAPGTYQFHCAVHGPSMSATLQVVGGAPLARPHVALRIASSKLARVRRAGKLKVKVTGSGSDARGVSLKATRGSRRIGHKSDLRVASGTTKSVKLKLSRKARRSLKGLHKAKIKVKAAVPYGSATNAKRTLR